MLSARGVRGRLSGIALAALLGAAPLLGGCEERKPKEQNIRDVVEAQKRAKRVKAEADLRAIQTALQIYSAEHGQYPESLEALPLVRDQRIDASLYAYDTATGQVRLREP